MFLVVDNDLISRFMCTVTSLKHVKFCNFLDAIKLAQDILSEKFGVILCVGGWV